MEQAHHASITKSGAGTHLLICRTNWESPRLEYMGRFIAIPAAATTMLIIIALMIELARQLIGSV